MTSSFLFGIKMLRVKDIALFVFPNIHVAVTTYEVRTHNEYVFDSLVHGYHTSKIYYSIDSGGSLFGSYQPCFGEKALKPYLD